LPRFPAPHAAAADAVDDEDVSGCKVHIFIADLEVK
jgi:hypothetical protein